MHSTRGSAPLPRHRFSRLRAALVLPMLGLFVVAIGATWSLYLVTTRSAMRQTAFSLAGEIAEHASARVGDYLAKPLAIGESLAAWLAEDGYAPLSPERADALARHFYAILERFPALTIASAGFTDGEYVESQRMADGELRFGRAGKATGGALESWRLDASGARGTLAKRMPDYDPRMRPWYLSAVSAGAGVWSDPYPYYSDGRFAISASVPILARGELLGVVSIALTLDRLGDFLGEAGRHGESTMTIIDREGRMVAAANHAEILADSGAAKVRNLATLSPDARIADLARGWKEARDSELFLFESFGDRFLGSAGKVQLAGADWTVLVALAESGFMAPLDAADTRNLAILLVTLAVALIAAWIVADRVVDPLLLLARTVTQLTPGERGAAAAISGLAARSDEIGTLATSFVDLEHRLEESFASLNRSLDEKEVLLREVHHRVKNNLQIISSILSIQSSEVQDAAARDSFSVCQDRIQTMAYVHEDLYQSGSFADISMDSYLGRILDGLRSADGRSVGITIDLVPEGVRLPLERAIPCGLMVNELVTNALKHAFPDRRKGSIRVRLAAADDGAFELEVRDDGIGMDSESVREGGIGRHLVESLVAQLRGQASTRSRDGVTVSVRFG